MMTDLDKAALQLALKLYREESSENAEYIDCKLAEDGFEEAATFAAFNRQIASLNLRPWECPPMDADISDRDPKASALLARMLENGVSRFAPDPLKAIREAKRRA